MHLAGVLFLGVDFCFEEFDLFEQGGLGIARALIVLICISTNS